MTAATPLPTRPFLAIYIAWHPSFDRGAAMAHALFQHYRRDLYQNVAGGSGLPVLYRFKSIEESELPLDIDFEDAECTAVILLVEENWTSRPEWVDWARRLSDRADAAGLRTLIFPVAIDRSGIERGVIPEQAIRWDEWGEFPEKSKIVRLITALSYQFCRMLRAYLEHLEHPELPTDDLHRFLRRVDVFLSHSKHDEYGTQIAREFRAFVHDRAYDSFFDVFDIPVGLRFNRVLMEKVKSSAVVAIHTDSFSTREWCRREMLQAKRFQVPLVVSNCIQDLDERGFPYMANVPIVRMDPEKRDRIDVIVARLMDEVLKDFLWRCRRAIFSKTAGDKVWFLPRPPELIVLNSISGMDPAPDTLIYPDPPIGAEERELFEQAAPKIRLLSATEWLAGGLS
jgi:hypothetical protein